MKLFLKVSRVGATPIRRVFAWTSLRARGLGLLGIQMSEAEAGEFEYAMEHDKHSVVGAGGQYEYRVYARVDTEIQYPYAIVLPVSAAVRAQYPESCRVVNVRTGMESALCDSYSAALDVVTAALAGQLKGSFM